jgi:hypothetical protein
MISHSVTERNKLGVRMPADKPHLLLDFSVASGQAMNDLTHAQISYSWAVNGSSEPSGPLLISEKGTFQGLEGVQQYMAIVGGTSIKTK